jgi:hypothetical protein
MFNKRVAITVCVLGLALGACESTPRVRSDADAKVNIANYHSYVWEQVGDASPAGGPAFTNPLNQKRLRAAVDANLAKYGLQPAAEGTTPDSYVTVAIGTRQNIEVENRSPWRFGFGYGWGGGWRSRSMGSIDWSTDGLYNYTEGRISVDLYDAKTREPLWHAAAEQDLSYLTGNSAEARINAAVAAMFTKFPGSASK